MRLKTCCLKSDKPPSGYAKIHCSPSLFHFYYYEPDFVWKSKLRAVSMSQGTPPVFLDQHRCDSYTAGGSYIIRVPYLEPLCVIPEQIVQY